MRFFVLAYGFIFISTILTGLLNGLGESRSAFFVQMASVLATLVVTVPLAWWGGVTFALAGGCVSVLLGIITGAVCLWQHSSRGAADAADPVVPLIRPDLIQG